VLAGLCFPSTDATRWWTHLISLCRKHLSHPFLCLHSVRHALWSTFNFLAWSKIKHAKYWKKSNFLTRGKHFLALIVTNISKSNSTLDKIPLLHLSWLKNLEYYKTCLDTYTHTHTHPFNSLCLGLPRWAGTRKAKPVWILLKQGTVSGSGGKSEPRSRQITTPVPHHSVFYRLDALPATQPSVSKHWRLRYFVGK